MVVPLFVGREKSIAALEAAAKNGNQLFLVTQKDASVLNPGREDLYDVGTVVSIIQMLRLPDNTVKVLIEGKIRARIVECDMSEKGHTTVVEECPDILGDRLHLDATERSIKTAFEQYVRLNKRIPPELLMSMASISDPGRFADIIVAHLTMKIAEKQKILEAFEVEKRLVMLLEQIQGEIEVMNVERRIRARVKGQVEKSQKEYYLNEQMSAIQRELGQKDDAKNEITEMEQLLESKKISKEGFEKVKKEIKKLKSMSVMSAESAVVRNYIDTMLSLPWQEYSEDNNDVLNARVILEKDHYGLKDVKERIVEYLAVKSLVGLEGKGSILCLAGPPGVGKTSIARSLAEALNRKFVRISLGGVRDEAEIRGHRRTYVGAMPGKIIQAIKKAGTSNPVVLLDEIDKMSSDFRGDPASAMLEVLDPEQNKSFSDHFIEVEYDLSHVMFIMTANDISAIPIALKDRMEIISIAGYTPFEKLQIAQRYLVKKAVAQSGLEGRHEMSFPDETVMKMISGHTREAGVRELERQIFAVARKVATEVVTEKPEALKRFEILIGILEKYLGPTKYDRMDLAKNSEVGLVNGLAVTSLGGEVLNIEVITVPGAGKIEVTGKLGEVMQESAKAALSYVKSISDLIGVDHAWYTKNDIHVHVPEGATPKDGPSAGITMATALISAITGIPVKQNVAMTGEITIRGRILPIGGLKEKMLAAKQSGIVAVIIPERNRKDLQTIPPEISDGLTVYPVTSVIEVFRLALALEKPEEFMRSSKRSLKVVTNSDVLAEIAT